MERLWLHPMRDISPAWEYYAPDPEAEFFVGCRPAGGFDGLSHVADFRAERMGANPGVRFGRGNPDHFAGRLAPERPRAPRKAEPGIRVCPTCGLWFRPDVWRPGKKHCSAPCYKPAGRPRTPACADRPCAVCGAAFRPESPGASYCSPACFRSTGRFRAPPPPPDAVRRCGEMFAAGMRVADIAAALAVSMPTVKRWRRRAGVPPRPTGNHSHERATS
jgi:hypothetical protein